MANKFIYHGSQEKLSEAVKIAQTFLKFYNTPQWDKHKIKFDKKFTVHETKTGTVVVNEI